MRAITHACVVFDNNAYKRVSRVRLERLMSAERDHHITPLANTAVLMELLARARDLDFDQRGRNRAAIRKLGLHCRTTRDGQVVVRFLAHIESQIYQLLAGAPHPDDKNIFNTLGNLVRVVSESSSDDSLKGIGEDLALIEHSVARVEADYVARLQALIAEDLQPDQMKRNLDYAARLAARAQQFYGLRFRSEEIVLRILDIARFTSIGFALSDSVVEEIRTKGGGHRQHRNTAWDEEVVSSTSMYTTIAAKPVLLVTEENRLVHAASLANAQERVCRIARYEEYLGLSPWPSSDSG